MNLLKTWILALLIMGCFAPQKQKKETETVASEEVTVVTSLEVDVVGKEVEYATEEVNMIGYMVEDANQRGKRPGILVIHEWWGHNDHARKKAEKLAQEGYVALAVDMYGNGQNTTHPADAQQFMEAALANLEEVQDRFTKAVETIKTNPNVDSTRIGVIGFCFGGSVGLSMASAGYDIDGVVALHAGLALPIMPEKEGGVTAKILIINGEADPFITEAQVAEFKKMMDAVKAEYEYISYPDVQHAFTNKSATAIGKEHGLPLAYNEAADKDSWARTLTFFEEIFN